MSETFRESAEQLTEEELAVCRAAAPQARRFAKVKRTLGGSLYTLYFRNPTRPEYKAFRQVLSADGREIEAFETLALTCAVKPSEAELIGILDDWPGLINSDVQATLGRLAGLTSDEAAKK